ncbi:Cytokinin-O-glucosyltransferase 2 [Hordeum vulgare]|nr:Cytokinin-O-glucosyltransferase 2 [Hordeum vulgare]
MRHAAMPQSCSLLLIVHALLPNTAPCLSALRLPLSAKPQPPLMHSMPPRLFNCLLEDGASPGGATLGGSVCSQPSYAHVVGGTSAENEEIKKVKKKKIKKKEIFCGFKMRFNPKRLGDLAQQLSPVKQGIIRNGLFGDLLDIKPLKVPHALIEFVVMHTNHALLEFKYMDKSIKFNKNMVKRIFNVPSGDSPMKLLKKSDEHDLHNIYKEGNRVPMAHVFKFLRDCSDTDEAMIKRTWALVVLVIVVCPGTGNMVNLEYLPSFENMDFVHNHAWDEHLLAQAMEEVEVFQEKKRGQATNENTKEFKTDSCFPMLAVCEKLQPT